MGRNVSAGLSLASVFGFMLIWQLGAMWLNDPLFLPRPWDVITGAAELVSDGTLISSMAISMMRILAGWLLGSIVAIPLGLWVGTSHAARAIVDPFIHFFRFVPAIALVTLFIVWFGVGEMSKILLIAYATTFIVMVNTASGVGAIPQEKIDAARCLGANRRQTFTQIVVPASIPSIYIGMRLALASSFLVIVAAEMLAASSGLGYIIWTSRLYFRIDWMFAAIILLGALGFLTDRVWKMLGREALNRYLRDAAKY
ncbi:ABC transporter permease [Devosia rhodophyticola]|uniref:ABC transporter permease n=1 Tax=Devosia rhodophyticola TaxID=3026423 RepID=A0ABY7Z182_9HYPH|nr:ABC transporter permease [Devosia rhodophyticola]WDR07291.1 ABC transporter permease [Devosia rhodophyticola]